MACSPVLPSQVPEVWLDGSFNSGIEQSSPESVLTWNHSIEVERLCERIADTGRLQSGGHPITKEAGEEMVAVLANTVTTLAIICGVLLMIIVWALVEGAVVEAERRRHPEREAKRPRYKPIWQFVGVIAWNAPLLPAVVWGGLGWTLVVVCLLFGAYGVFRYRLARSPAMQRRFLRSPLPPR